MRYYRRPGEDGHRLVVADGDAVHDLTAVRPELRGFGDLARAAAVAGAGVDEVAARHLDAAPTLPDVPDDLATPVVAGEVWAAGVTYEISEAAREEESGMPEIYLDVYDAERPELFLKATPSRTVGPGEAVGVRADSSWDVPEPELGVVLYRGDVVGYTAGNDVSSRDIEGANPLYLPQAKVYDRCCALGPAVASPETVGDPHDLEVSMTVRRDGDPIYEGETSTGAMVRRCEDLVEWLTAHNDLPDLAVLLTGTSLVPPDEFTLTPGDRVRVAVESVGTLTNGVREV
ncbi:MAG: fumarylacetoacetate hydrolase family protein [Haloferacaceae archaeon]